MIVTTGSPRIAAGGRSPYIADLSVTESPYSDKSRWTCGKARGKDWNDVIVSGGLMFGTQPGSGVGVFDDSIGCVSGFDKPNAAGFCNQWGRGVVHRAGTFSSTTTRECEILLRWSIDKNVATGYEFNHAFDGQYCGWVRWNGARDQFTAINAGTPAGALTDGSIMYCTAIDNVLSAYINYGGTGSFQLVHQVNIVTDVVSGAVYTTGSPGAGFWRQDPPSGNDTDSGFCFSAFSAGVI